MTKQVLLIEDDDAMRFSLTQTMDLEGMTVLQANGLDQAKRAIRTNFNGVILSDIRMPLRDGFDVLSVVKSIDTELPVIMLTGEADVPMALRAMKAGAYDFLEKPCATQHLIEVLNRALDYRALVTRARQMEQRIKRQDAAAFNFPGTSDASKNLRTQLRNFADKNVNIHLLGPSGAGKRLAAYTLHSLAQDRSEIHSLNYETPSQMDIDQIEVGENPADISVKNLHQASTDQIEKLTLFGVKNPDLRIITSSTKPFDQLGDAPFRQQLNPITINIPDLRARRHDLHTIFETILRVASRSLNSDMPPMNQAMLAQVMARNWDGNLPEMRSYARSILLGTEMLPSVETHITLADQMDAFEKRVLSESLRRNEGHAVKTAQELGLPRKTFYDRLARHDLRPKEFKSSD